MKSDYQRETFELEDTHWWYRARRRILIRMVEHGLGCNPKAQVLDVGCGAGTILMELAARYQAFGLDLVPEAATFASQRSGRPVMLGTIPQDVPKELKSLDGVCLFDVIEHIDDDVRFLQDTRTLLKPGGAVFISVPALQWLYGQHDRMNEHRRRYCRRLLTQTLARAGFAVEWCSYFNFLLSPLLIPAVLWKGRKQSGHNFEVKTMADPWLEAVMGLEATLLIKLRFPIGLSLAAIGRKSAD